MPKPSPLVVVAPAPNAGSGRSANALRGTGRSRDEADYPYRRASGTWSAPSRWIVRSMVADFAAHPCLGARGESFGQVGRPIFIRRVPARMRGAQLRGHAARAANAANAAGRHRLTATPRPSGSLAERVHHPRRIDERRTRVQRNRDAERFRHFLLGRAMLGRFRGVHGDTAVAARRDGDRERDQFARLRVEMAVLAPAPDSAL